MSVHCCPSHPCPICNPPDDYVLPQGKRRSFTLYSYAHMCRMDHVQIGHSDSEHEQCPLCRVISALQNIIDTNKEFRAGMPDGWEGDPLQDACDVAEGLLASVGTPNK